ncbi:hypothetical protein AMATHDRAFT_56648 [Amanita thiersii Skay4041]|uniref:DUF6741 domain-containing protein n=1 Tax=Amanita thiersii Skay4041 TaxID=703135 RepID=A0A2A9NXS0_9AGAR|nr:hypothetical protein AMATHDRAFT_56648 [Amanita thiersii Skay4041]
MATLATVPYAPMYDSYDNYGGMSRSLSRRQSLAYGAPPPLPYTPGAYDPHAQPYAESYPVYGSHHSTAVVPLNHRLAGPSREDLRDPYYADDRLAAVPLTSHPSMGLGMSTPRHRRHSTVSLVPRPPVIDPYRLPGSLRIKFKRKGVFSAGITLADAQSHVRLSNNDHYTLHDLHANSRGRILLKIRWNGYSSLTYEIPLDSYDGRISLQTLARRISRACVHFLQANIVPVVWDRVELHHIEEIAYGVWQPMLSVR